MKKWLWLSIIPLVISMCMPFGGRLLTNNEDASELSKAQTAQKLQNLHIPFIVNEGQTDERVKFYANTFGGSVYVTKDGEIVYVLPKVVKPQTWNSDNNKELAPKEQFQHNEAVALKEEVVNGKFTEITGEGKSVTQVNYFTGNDQSKWKTNIPTYETANLGEVYAGIDLKLKAYRNNVEKLFTVRPDADPETIRLKLSGAKALKINRDGQLEVRTELGAVKFTRPVAYQEVDGKRVEVPVRYRIQKSAAKSQKAEPLNPKSEIQNLSPTSIGDPKSEYGFTVASYDRTKDLIIDPLLASTYVGGSGDEAGLSVSIDTGGNVYVAGYTLSANFPTSAGVYQPSFRGVHDAYVLRISGDLKTLLASTYLGGSNSDEGDSVAIDAGGNVYVTGLTTSTDFPTTPGAYQSSFKGYKDAFVSRLSGDLTKLLVSTYVGGSGEDAGSSLAIDAGGNVYVTGYTYSTNFPTSPGAYQTSFKGWYDAFISRLSGDLKTLLASTYFGGSGSEGGSSVAIDAGGNVYVTDMTSSTDFPTTPGAYQTFNKGISDAFVSRCSGDLTKLLASTYVGGSNNDGGYNNAMAIDTGGNVYAICNTSSTDFPTTPGAYQTFNKGGYDVSVFRLDSNLSGNNAPVANAGADQSVHVGNTVTLDGSGSTDIDGNLLTYSWAFTSKPLSSTATLVNPTSVNPTFTVDKAGTYVVRLVVNDGMVNSAPDTVTVSTLNSAPVANAGTDQSVYVANTVTLDGSGSHDVDGNLLTYTWAFTTVPAGSSAALSSSASVNPTFYGG